MEYMQSKESKSIIYFSNTDKLIVEELKKLFSDGKYNNVSDIKIQNTELYSLIDKQAKRHHLKIIDYLASLGWNKNYNSNSRYDYYNLNNLLDKYKIKEQDLSNIFKCSRQNINQKKKVKNYTQNNLWIIPLSQEEINIIVNNINQNKICFFSQELSYMIFDKIDSNDKKALLLRNNNIIKLSYELHTDIKKSIRRK